MQIAAIIPTYNEADNISKLLSALFHITLDISVLVVDDNSPDGTGRLTQDLARKNPRLHVMHRPAKGGLRAAYLAGISEVLAGTADAVLQMDADLSHDPRKIPEMVSALQESDVVHGSRYMPGGSLDSSWPIWRRGLSNFGNHYAKAILRIPATDVTTGFRLWKASTLAGMPLGQIQSTGYVFLVELAYMAHCLEYRIGEIPIHFAERRAGRSKMSLGIQAEAALRVWQVWWHHRDLRRRGRGARAGYPVRRETTLLS